MAFLIYKKTAGAETVRYEKIKPLKLGGAGGFIAQYVKTLPGEKTRSWKLDAPLLLKLAGVGRPDGEFVVLFDVTGRDSTSVCLYELLRIHGSCLDTSTQLALDFSVVIDQEIDSDPVEFAGQFEVKPAGESKLLGETLALTGGPGGGDWKWAGTSLQLGATVVQARHSHGSGEPCANCSCGRRAALNN
jgi:hypothetical protein